MRTSNPWALWKLALLLGLWMALAGNLPLWRVLSALPEHGGARGLLFSLAIAIWIAAALTALLSLVSWPRVFKPVALLLLVAVVASAFMLQFGVVIDSTMMANVVNTDVREVRDLVSWPLAGILLLIAGAPAWWLLRQPVLRLGFWPQAWRNALGLCAGILVVLGVTVAAYQDLASLMRNHKHVQYLVNPLNVLYGGGKLLAEQLPQVRNDLQVIGLDAKLGASYAAQSRPPLLVLVVGETARAANFS